MSRGVCAHEGKRSEETERLNETKKRKREKREEIREKGSHRRPSSFCAHSEKWDESFLFPVGPPAAAAVLQLISLLRRKAQPPK